MNREKKTIVYILMVSFMFSGMVLQTNEYSSLTNILIIIPSILILFLSFLSKNKIKITLIDSVFLLFVLMGIIGSIINNDMDNLLSVLKQAIFYLIIVLYQRNLIPVSIYFNSFLLSGTVLIGVSLYQEPLYLGIRNYKGIFQNPNNLGVFAATVLVAFLVQLILSFSEEANIVNKVIAILMCGLSLYLVIISASRTAFVAIAAITLIVMILQIFLAMNNGKVNTKILFSFLLFILLVPMIIVVLPETTLFQAVDNNILTKFAARQGDLTASRDIIWSFYLENSKVFGTPNNYINNLIGFSAHNSFISQIGQLGWAAGIFYLTFWILVISKSITFFSRNLKSNKFNFFPILAVFVFVLMSMMEVLTHAAPVYLALIGVGLILRDDEITL